jgi:GNAT superfamily N-acetyltransferase
MIYPITESRSYCIKEYRNQGYGRELMKRVINEVRNFIANYKNEIYEIIITTKQ